MSTEILSDEVRRKVGELDDVLDSIAGTIEEIFETEMDYCDSIPEGIKKRDQLIQKLKDGLWEANHIMGQIKPYSKDAEGLAEMWSDAYRADCRGRETSVAIISALLENMNKEQAEWFYRSKHLRWMFDSKGDFIPPDSARRCVEHYLNTDQNNIKQDLAELPD
jgi:hypothetical protein